MLRASNELGAAGSRGEGKAKGVGAGHEPAGDPARGGEGTVETMPCPFCQRGALCEVSDSLEKMAPVHRVTWVSATGLVPPHRVVRPEQVEELRDAMAGGWDRRCPALVGYPLGGVVQLLSGSHRWAAAREAGVLVPVVVVPYESVRRAHGDLAAWAELMAVGDGRIS